MTPLEAIDRKIAQMRRDLETMEQARAIMAADPPPAQNLEGSTAREAALAILRESNGDALHFRIIYDAAYARGYRPRQGTDEQAAIDTFRSALNRIPKDVDQVGDGLYRVRVGKPLKGGGK